MQHTNKIGLLLILLVVILLIRSDYVWLEAQVTPTEAAIETSLDNRISTFFKDLNSGNTSRPAFEELFRDGSVNSRTPSEAIDTMSTKYAELKNSDIGILHNLEKIDSKWIGKDLIVMRYLFKHENAPVIWYFTFYRSPRSAGSAGITANQSWNAIMVRFDTSIEPLMLK